MTLPADEVWRLLRLVPALGSGIVTCTIAFLLARKLGIPLYRVFGWMVLSFLTYGAADFLTRELWMSLGWSHWATRLSGGADVAAMAWMTKALIDFTSSLRGVSPSRFHKGFSNLPLASAAIISVFLFIPGIAWTEPAFAATGLGFLGVLLTTAVVCGVILLGGHQPLHDSLRPWALGMGWLVTAFVPLWVLEALRVVQWGGFAWFFLLCNLMSLATMVRTHFQPESSAPKGLLFDEVSLARCAARYAWTERETEVANLHARGFSSTEVAGRLFIAPKTARNHVSNLYAKTGVHHRMALLERLVKG